MDQAKHETTYVRGGKHADYRSDKLGSKVFEDIGGHDGSGHGRSRDLSKTCNESQISSSYALVIDVIVIDVQATHRCNDVRFDVIFDTLFRQGHGKSDQTG